MRASWLVVSSALAACADLAPREEGVCGNDVVDPVEDCDGRVRVEHADSGAACAAPGTAHACHYVCNAEATCPAGWGCGADGKCRYASGRYAAAPAGVPMQPFATITLGDVDGDGRREVLVSDLDAVQVLVPAGDGSFRSETSVALPWFKPRAAFGDLDGDGRTDLIAGSNFGVVELLGDESRSFTPFVHPRFRAPVFPQSGILTLSAQTSPPLDRPLLPDQHVFAVSDGGGMVRVTFRNQQTFAAEPPSIELPHPYADLRIGIRTDLDGNGTDEHALVCRDASTVEVVSPVVASTGDPVVTSIAVQTVTLPASVGVVPAAAFIDADGDGKVDLFVSQPNGRAAIAPNLGGGVLGPAVLAPKFDALVQPSGGSAVPFAAIDLGSAGRGWVGVAGVFRDAATPVLIDRPSVLWAEAVVGDFNRDGRDDIAAVSYNTAGIDLWLQSPSHLFAHARVATQLAPAGLLVGDFDGDGTSDVAFFEGSAPSPITVKVVYGGPQGLGAPVTAGAWTEIDSIDTASVQITPDVARDGITDLAVQGVIGGERSLTYLIGTAKRELIGPYVTRTEQPGSTFITGDFSLVGSFGSPGGFAPDQRSDLALLGFGPADPTRPTTRSLNAWIVAGTGGGGLSSPARTLAQPSRVVPTIDRIPIDPGVGLSRCSSWQAADLDGDRLDEIIGLTSTSCTNTQQLFVGHPDGTGRITFSDQTIPLRLELTGYASQVEVVDINRDRTPEVLLSSNLGVTVFFRTASGAYDPVALPTSLGVPFMATVVNADDDPELEIVAGVIVPTSADNLVVFELGLDHRSFVAKGGAGTIDFGELRATDVNSDGLDDLLLLDPVRNQLQVLLAIPHGTTL